MKIMRLKDVMTCTGLGRSSIYKFMLDGSFPKSVSLGSRAVGWVESEVYGWISGKMAARDPSAGACPTKPEFLLHAQPLAGSHSPRRDR